MSQKTIEAVLRVSSKLGSMAAFTSLGNKLAQVDRQAKAYNRTQSAVVRAQREMSTTIMRYAAPAALAAFGAGAVKEFAGVERQLTRTGLTLGATRKDMQGIGRDIEAVARAYALPADQVMATVDAYAAAGADLSEIRSDLNLLAKAQQAIGASGADTVATWDAARKSLGLTTNEAERFFELVAAGGAAGKFEGRDMAAELPSMLPIAARNGMRGTEGAASLIGFLEVAADFAGSASEAATMTRDLLEKVNSPEVLKKFKEHNVDLADGMERAAASGEDLFSALHRFIREATGGDARKLGFLFGDKESRAAAGVVMQNIDRIKAAQDEVRRNAPGVLDKNVNAVLADTQAKLDRLAGSWDRFQKSVGAAAAPTLGKGMDFISEEILKGQAIDLALDRDGLTDWEKGIWKLKANFDPAMRDSKAWEGDFKTDYQSQALDHYRNYARSRAAAGALPAVSPGLPKDSFGLPASGPVPAGRPGADLGFDAEYARQMAARPYSPGSPVQYAPGATPRDAERDSMQALARQGNDVADAIADALASGGRKAAGEVEQSGQGIGQSIIAAHERGAAIIRDAIHGALAHGVRVNEPHRVRGDLGYSTEP
jgi:TP901 family phage tail tape measure protein